MGYIQLQFRKGTSSEWALANPILANAEIGVEIDTGLFKIGSGSNTWNTLPYSSTYWTSLVGLPSGLVSASTQVDYTQLQNIPANIVSSSTQVDYTQLQNIPANIVSSSTQVDYTQLQNIPANIVSSSTQVDYTQLQNIPVGIVSQSSQIDVRNTTGIETLATTASNTFTGQQVLANSTNSTAFNNGALVVSGGIGVGKDVNVSGSLTVLGLFTAVSMSFQYITSSIINAGTSRILLNNDDVVRYAGISVLDSGSSAATASLLYDSLNNDWVFEKTSEEGGSGSILLFGPLSNTIDTPIKLTPNYILKAENNNHGHHVTTSSIYDDGSLVRIIANSEITGSLSLTGVVTGSVSGTLTGSFSYNQLVDVPSGIISSSTQVFPYTGSALVNGDIISINDVFANVRVQNNSLVTGSLKTTNTEVWVGSDSAHELALIIAGTPAFKVSNISNFVPVTDALQDIGENSKRIKTLWVANVSSSTPIDSASYAITASYALNGGGGGPVTNTVRFISASEAILSTDSYLIVMSGFVTMSLPSADAIVGKEYSIKNLSTGSVMVVPSGSNIIDSYSSMIIAEQNSLMGLVSIGPTGWAIF